MPLLRFLLCLFAFIGALAAAGTLVLSVVLMLRFPPVLVAVALACWILSRGLNVLRPPRATGPKSTIPSEQ